MWEGMELLTVWSVCVQRADNVWERSVPRLPCGQGRGNPVIGFESLCCMCYIASGEVSVRRQFLFVSAAIWMEVRIPAWRCVSVLW